MVLSGATIYNDGVGIGHDCEEKIRQIMNAIKSISPSSDVSMRFVKNGQMYEGLLWGKANDIPIGVYRRGTSMSQVLENLYRRVKKECLKALRMTGQSKSNAKSHIDSQMPLAMAG
jgi:hypothetical protein